MSTTATDARPGPDPDAPSKGGGTLPYWVSGDTNAERMTLDPNTSRIDDERPISLPASEVPPDTGPRRIAFGGAGICIAVLTAAAAMTASIGRLRRRHDTVPRD